MYLDNLCICEENRADASCYLNARNEHVKIMGEAVKVEQAEAGSATAS